ncbi:hypothetical protein UACE39S_03492 [Ureibacillus acetophenoni]
MKLQSLLEKFTAQLQPNEKCFESTIWCLPVHTIQVSYKPVLRRQMDILMKMLLITVQKAHFHNASQISEILLVEQLFVQDLLSKMEKMKLIERNEQGYEITEKGKAQLESGVYEEDQDITSVELIYSSTHEHFLTGDLEEVLEFEDFPEQIYRYYQQSEQPSISSELLIKEIQSLDYTDEEDEGKSDPIFITSFEEIQYEQINDIPCIELLIYNEQTDKIYPRIWNTLLNKWDSVIEKEIIQNESATWKEKILEGK